MLGKGPNCTWSTGYRRLELDPRSVECHLLGYASGNGNYKVQVVSNQHVFVSQDVIFEEGHPRWTLMSGGEETHIPLFNTLETLPLDNEATDPDIEEPGTNTDINDDPGLEQSNQRMIPVISGEPH